MGKRGVRHMGEMGCLGGGIKYLRRHVERCAEGVGGKDGETKGTPDLSECECMRRLARLQRDGTLHAHDCAVGVARRGECHAQCRVDRGVVRLAADGALEEPRGSGGA